MATHVSGTPLLRPGARLLRRDAGHLQLGLDPDHAVVVPDTPEHRALLTAWNRGDLRELLATHPLGSRLTEAGLVVTLPDAPFARGDRYAAAARLLTGEASTGGVPPIVVESFGSEPGARLAARLTALLTDAGCPPQTDQEGKQGKEGKDAAPGLIVLAGVGQPTRTRLDPWARAGVPHLAVRLDEGVATVGPFVEPGRTACLRCVDAHHGDEDPRWPLLVEQRARLDGCDRPDGVPEPVDPALAAIAAGWAVRDVLAWTAGLRPSTWSATVRLGPEHPDLRTRAWARHPGCGCGWDLSATMTG
ncbi:bacteriocin biosynthesis cyclodehydratase domain-containing protein [Nocardioides massiliensis]|uniref:Bacteriocin biosynthesis cyclodehydratase domain-containing protein n=3 Tax=Nocardioides massiliensis TaxID=1325935 RepID=A0ABT9NUK7_9ACTN|nr:hypothetical protein [Nocardioides massiliensis]MDP9824104.1 bacteriocin biosynthesis cyclodehydratase domain-containing protein [Nocardioides massiliensis]